MQTVKAPYSVEEGVRAPKTNFFSIFVVTYSVKHAVYELDGRAYNDQGEEVAEWNSPVEGLFPTFSQDGVSVSYFWDGQALVPGELYPFKEGVATLRLSGDNEGSGKVAHVSQDRNLIVEVERVTTEYLFRSEFTRDFDLSQIRDHRASRNELALALVRARPIAGI